MTITLPILLGVFVLGIFTGFVFAVRNLRKEEADLWKSAKFRPSGEDLRQYEQNKRNEHRLESYSRKRNNIWL